MDGWCTVRRARARGSPGQQGGGGFKASTRFKVPSSAISMPSLALEDVRGDEEDGGYKRAGRPHLEKSSSSACMSAREQLAPLMLDELGEERAGNSEESLEDATDAGSIKKKKDQLNQSKQKAMKSLSGETEEKLRLEKATSFPLSHGDLLRDREPDPMTDSGEGGTTIVVEVAVEQKSATEVEFESGRKRLPSLSW